MFRVAVYVLVTIGLAACGATATEADQKQPVGTSATTSTPTTAPAQPKTLEAATAAAQEWADRRAAGDYAGVWLLFDRQVKEGISQDDYVTLSETCTSSLTKMPTTAVGVRLDGPDKAIARLEVMGFKIAANLVYEDGQWLLQPEPEFAADLGKPVQEIISTRKARGDCHEE
ncbi:hypothetical protein A5765_21690 [Mycolicibacterium celeriflavum]|uniref:hypothetical protein n=1 Tax=Mycolicibacterium celeriflavum TaxID=1249101 RepID=UPI0007FE613C|nr:hypothetical protein [Mycolicibacterium celeriflavum]OBG21762.1 hypothetical protein A5765_21690 [Mycolicibacterium celeriflavum]